ncbi:hypothetical protein BABINDRAFT_37665 [Babjeviella inositovora NRRL Y-12698]|uniref:Cytochrome b-c1 complex subunit 6, mitochondrial n=1 Tax=Babjeviella inositovora NRRL Y-12698 TaxID=984486 RepID=A0A1E3QPG6_9ASCO|nr:uncharacterized protein BABINDRAFT_37665 [Babjeviella inositovora NRRL Y-12698]ODQ79593.1 hypothetical protein BABINDRAFT_37665 [Babjeviella inositovora NRRL Y-12698]
MFSLTDLIEAVIPAAYAEEPVEEVEEIEEVEEVEEEEEEEEDDDDEEKDPMDVLRDECSKTAACKPYVHHYHECIERVTAEQQEEGYEDKHHKEDCVEEFFHLQHCLNDCLTPRLFSKLK